MNTLITRIPGFIIGLVTGWYIAPYIFRYLERRRITVSKQGIHFEVKTVGQINAHWIDFIGQGLDTAFENRILRSMIRFWFSFGLGIRFIIRGDWQ